MFSLPLQIGKIEYKIMIVKISNTGSKNMFVYIYEETDINMYQQERYNSN